MRTAVLYIYIYIYIYMIYKFAIPQQRYFFTKNAQFISIYYFVGVLSDNRKHLRVIIQSRSIGLSSVEAQFPRNCPSCLQHPFFAVYQFVMPYIPIHSILNSLAIANFYLLSRICEFFCVYLPKCSNYIYKKMALLSITRIPDYPSVC